MPSRVCARHGQDYPCTCAMGNLYRFVEPVVLLLLSKKGCSYGYDLSGELQRHALTDAEIERAALYRVLRQLEMNGNVTSEWEVEMGGPARRLYKLTPKGREHLDEWATVLGHLSHSMARFVREVRGLDVSGVARPRPRVRNRAPHSRASERPPAAGRG
jgi:PadR family transcriptional regulator PadR